MALLSRRLPDGFTHCPLRARVGRLVGVRCWDARLIAAPLALATLAACGILPGRKHVEKNTMTKQQAVTRVEQIIRETIAVLQPTPKLEMDEAMSQDSERYS